MKREIPADSRRSELGMKILHLARNELYSYFPYMDGAFASVGYRADEKSRGISVDGEFLYYQPEYLIRKFQENPVAVRRGYLHMLLHCLYLHLFPEKGCNRRLWNLACDIVVEVIIENVGIEPLHIPVDEVRCKVFQVLRGQSVEAGRIYQMLLAGKFSQSLEVLEAAFSFDDHSHWYEDFSSGKRAKMRQKWEKILAYTGQNKNRQRKKAGTQKGDGEEEIVPAANGKYDYRKFLRQFSILREEVELDTESFDYIYYHLGMDQYGNMPLIEPLEYKEVYRLQELVIAIDTSGSCTSEIVQRFLEETYTILSDRENFFRKMKVYIIQCDCYVQDVAVLHNEEEWKEYCKKVKIQGRGGTDFRPVFRYVDQLIEKKELQNLKALIYFTDGDGIYPPERRSYETAFVFLRETIKMELVPAWARILLVNE